MIVYDELWKTMKKKGMSTYALREHYNFHSVTIRRLKNNENVETDTLNRLCEILDCRLDEIATYIKD